MTNLFCNFYDRLTEFILDNLNFSFSTILEAGCGQGDLTIPFVKKISKLIEKFNLIAFDLSAGSYSNNLDFLEKKIQEENFKDVITIMQGDVRNMEAIENESIDLIFSNELFCELDRRGLMKTLNEFYRILKPKGQMAHAELNPVPENISQRLFIEADKHSLDTSQPKPDWFSPFSDEIAVLMHNIGFKDITIKYIEFGVRLDYESAIKALKNWTVDPEFIKEHDSDLRSYGIEYPLEHIVFCKK